MKKITLLFYALLLATVGAWAQDATKSTTDWIDYTGLFPRKTDWHSTYAYNSASIYNVAVTISSTEQVIGTSKQENIQRPWLQGGNKTFTFSVPDGYKIAAYQITTKYVFAPAADETATNTFTYTTADGTATSPVQSTGYTTVTVDNLDVQSFTLITDNITNVIPNNNLKQNGIYIYNLRLKLIMDLVDATINVKNGTEAAQYTKTVKLPVGETVTFKDYVPEFSFVTYGSEKGQVVNGTNTFNLSYNVDTDAESQFPFATSYDDLNTEDANGHNKWMSMFTLNGRMHVYDDASEGNVYEYMEGGDGTQYEIISSTKKYPTIDKATFTRLNSGFFWGFVRASRFSPTYIVNKGADADKKLYLTVDGEDKPLLFTNADGQVQEDEWVTNEWAVTKVTTQTEDGKTIPYYGIKAVGTEMYISNNGNKGYMTTDADITNGSSVKLTSKLETYEILKNRALNAPGDAVHSLNSAARQKVQEADQQIASNPSMTVQEKIAIYEAAIKDINDTHTDAGFIDFEAGKYYYLRNYTPAGEGQKTYVLASEDGTTRTATEVTEGIGDADNAMTYFNINSIWQISTDESKPGEAPGTGIGASRTIARKVTHANSGMQLGAVNSESLVANGSGSDYYFIDLGAGQHFMKNVQYNGSGQQAAAKPLSCTDGGDVQEGPEIHKKNTRDTWYGIQVKSIDVEIGSTGYATIYLPFGVTLPTGEDATLEAYAVTAAGDGVATLAPVTSIPAQEGVILKGEANKTYTLTIDDQAAWEGITNLLKGSCMAKNVSDDAYVLSQPDGKGVGLYKAEKSSGTWKNNDNKAYLLVDDVNNTQPVESRFLSFNFDTVTGLDVISGTEPASTESVVYDLSGRRVRNVQKGLYIVNGKKVIK